MSSHQSTKKGGAAKAALTPDYPSQVRFAELLKLRGLSASTQEEYQRYIRKLATRIGRDPADLDEAAVRGHVLHLKDAHHYSASSMRTAVAALRNFYGHLLGHEWRLFDLVSLCKSLHESRETDGGWTGRRGAHEERTGGPEERGGKTKWSG